MASITKYKNSKSIKNGVKTYYDESGNVTTDPLKMKQIDTRIKYGNAPVTELKGLNKSAPDVNKRGVWQSSFSSEETQANKEKLATEREQRVSDLKAGFNKEDLSKLNEQQIAELKNIDLLNQNQEALSVRERNRAAGLATVNAVRVNLGLDSNLNPNEAVRNMENKDLGIIGKGAKAISDTSLEALGFVTGTSIMGVSISNLFASSEQANIDNLAGDISKNVAEATRITKAATSRGANVQQAINSLNQLEDSVNFKYEQAINSLKNDPRDIKNGLDLTDDMSYSLRAIAEQRQALERYKLTGDVNQVLNVIDTTETTQA